jgi:hypothetical protein
VKCEQRIWRDGAWNIPASLTGAQLVLAFGSGGAFDPALLQHVRSAYPRAHVLGGMTAGEISGACVHDGALITTAMELERAHIEVASAVLAPRAAELSGFQLADRLPKQGLKHVFVVSNGVGVNGSALAWGIRELLPPTVGLSGGLVADTQLDPAQVVLDDYVSATTVAAVGFYGDALAIGHTAGGGFRPFGPERRVTKSEGHVLHELDGEPAIELYRRYLGTGAGLPVSGQRFPLSLPGGVLRPLLAADASTGALTFAGELPAGSYVRLTRASHATLVEGAEAAARLAVQGDAKPQLTLVVSGAGRRVLLGRRSDEELEAITSHVGPCLAGFYAPGVLGDQALTLTTFAEH